MDSNTVHGHLLRVLMLPWLAHGHIFPYLELAKKLSQRNFYIYFCSTPINLSSVREQLIGHHNKEYFPLIQLVEIHLPSLPNLQPNNHTTKSLPPHLMSTLKTAFDMAEPSFYEILRTLNPDLLIYDFIQPWAPQVAASLNIPAVHFLTASAIASCYLSYQTQRYKPGVEFPFQSICALEEHQEQQIIQLLESSANDLSNQDRSHLSIQRSLSIMLIKSFREIEVKYIDHLSFVLGKEIVPVGPLVQESGNDGKESKYFIEWLNKKDKSSTVFVSFGSEYYMTREEIEETAYGLELSKVNFIWVIRFPDDHELSVDEVLPQGFLERVKERGLVVDGWAPQVEILRHSSIGGFVSHCGWSSVMEGMKFGQPIIAMPMHLDQPLNAKLVVELGVGVEVHRGRGGKIASEEVAKVIREVVVEKEGEKVRRRVKEISEKMKKQGEEELDVVVEKLLHLCSIRSD